MTRYLLSLVAFFTPLVSWANRLDNPLGFRTIEEFLIGILNVIVTIAFPVIVLFIVFIGFKFIAAQGNAEKLKEVRQYFFWAIVGALIILGAQALSLAIQGTVSQLSQGI